MSVRPATFPTLALFAAAALCLSSCRKDAPEDGVVPPAENGTGGGAGADPAAPPDSWADRERRDYTIRVNGPPWPWNEAVYVQVTHKGEPEDVRVWALAAGPILVRRQYEGDRWLVRSEHDPVPVERRMRWFFEEQGIFGAETELSVTPPQRALVALTGDARRECIDVITLYHEESGSCAVAIRDPVEGVLVRVWDRRDARFDRPRQTRPRPFTFDDFGPGTFVVAGRVEGRQWVAARATLIPGKTLTIDTLAAPAGGGRVECADPNAVLLLGGKLPIPFPRVADRAELLISAIWDGVPPGAHALLLPDGSTVPVEVTEGAKILVPRGGR